MTIILAPGYRTTYDDESDMEPCIPSSKENPQWYYEVDEELKRVSEYDRIKRHGRQIS